MSSDTNVIRAELREKLSKGANRRLRTEGTIPAVLYSKKGNLNLAVPVAKLPKAHSGHKILALDVDGQSRSVIMREVQVDPLTSKPIHFDFQEVTADDVVAVRVPVELAGFTREQDKEGSLNALIRSVTVKGPLSKIPEKISVDVSTLKVDETAHLGTDILPAGVTLRGPAKLAIARLIRK